MKSSYKLFGIYLDHAALPAHAPIIEKSTSLIDDFQDIAEPYSLFDLTCYQRKASSDKLLSFESFSEVEKFINQAQGCEKIAIMLDFASIGSPLNVFFLKRLLQLVKMLSDRFPQIAFVLASKPEDYALHEKVIEAIYDKRNHSSKEKSA